MLKCFSIAPFSLSALAFVFPSFSDLGGHIDFWAMFLGLRTHGIFLSYRKNTF